jgi:hypothetical protein
MCIICGGTVTAKAQQLVPEPVPVAQEILAWRGWRLLHEDAGWFLHSVNHDVRWDGPALTADAQPTKTNSSGLYALMAQTDVMDQGYAPGCVGEVALSGIVVVGESGYRAERAVIRRLIFWGYPSVDVRPIEIIGELGERYQCQVLWEAEAPPPRAHNYNLSWSSQNIASALTSYQAALHQQQVSGMGGLMGGLGNMFPNNLLGP